MKVSSRKLLLHILAGQVLSICFFGIKAMWGLDKEIIPSLQMEWVLANMLESVTLYYVPVCLASIVLSVSVFNSSHANKAGGTGKLQGGILAVLLVAMVIYIGLIGFGLGQARIWQIQTVTVSKEFNATMEEAADSWSKHDYTLALDRTKFALQLVPGATSAVNLRDEILRKMDTSTLENKDSTTKSGNGPKGFSGYSYSEIVEKGHYYLDEGDWFTALYFLGIAEKEREDDEVLFLISKAREGASTLQVEGEQSKKRERYLVKRDAVLELIPNGMWEKAYFELLKAEDLARSEGMVPETVVGAAQGLDVGKLPLDGKYADPDVRLYLPLVVKNLQEISFFEDEFDGLAGKHGQGSLVFLNAEDNGLKQYVYFRAIYPGLNRAYYLFDPEYILIDGAGNIKAQVQAEAGKIVDHQLLLRSMDRVNADSRKEARITGGKMDPNLMNSIQLSFSGSELYGFTASVGAGGNLSFAEQISLFDSLKKAGMNIKPVELSLLDYLIRALSAISLGILAWITGASLRSRSLTRPVMLILLSIPLIVLAAVLGLDLYYFLATLASRLVFETLGFWSAIWINAGIQAAQLLVCLFIFAGISAREE